ncbi:auxin-induced protein 22B-like [Impatiens glandulifera]|uniref:auxin-induced protein 22B-like n=1 Tax=Impatiens glandulifera TaxID=253017 RepID=UPI001FB11A48|nr:auxin-induced protein 22B-like [Impatiens glandulifera]
MDSHDWINLADTELTLRFPGDPPPVSSSNGWPPVRGRRIRKKGGEEEGDQYCTLVKVAVDGAPFLRKVDLESFSTYQELLRTLLEMFDIPPRGEEAIMMMISRVVVKGIEYIPTYEDKDGDWMLLGDVPWE